MPNNRPKEQNLAKLVNNLPAMLYRFMLRPNGSTCFPYVNSWGLRLFNFNLNTLQDSAQPLLNMLYPDDAASFHTSIQASAATMQPWLWTGRVILPEGNVIYVQANATPEAQADGSIVWSGMLMEITGLKQAEEELARERNLLHTLIDNLPDTHVFVKDAESRFIITNAAHLQTLGLRSLDEVVGKTDFALFPEEFAEQYFADEQAVIRSGQGVLNRVEPVVDSSGRQKWYLTNKLPLHDNSGIVTGLVGMSVDITDRIVLEQQSRQSLERRGHQVRVATQISQEITTITGEQELYHRVITTIKEQFGFYHAQLFRYNPDEAMLDLVAGYGQIGDQMVMQQYRQPVNQGLLGQAAAFGQPVLQPNLANVPNWQPHPLLPETQGTLMVPLRLGGYDATNLALALQSFIDYNVIGYIVNASDTKVITPICRQALEQGLVVVVQGTLGKENQTAQVSPSGEYEMGYILGCEAGRWGKAHLSATETLQVATFDYLTDGPTSSRQRGMIAGLEETLGRAVVVIANEIAASGQTAQPVAERWLKQYPHLKMILAVNDSVALGAYRALKSVNKNNANHFFIGGVDGLDDALEAIAEGGVFQATVDQLLQEQARAALYTLVAAVTGQPYQAENTIQVQLINQSNLAQVRAARANGAINNERTDVNLSGQKIGLSVFDLSNPFHALIAQIITQEAARFGLEVFVHDPKPLLGVLEVQSNVVGQLQTEDLLVLEGIAGQLALAIEKTRLLEQASIFRQFAQAAGQGMGFTTLKGEVVYFNPSMGALLGEPKLEDALGKSIYSYYHSPTIAHIENEVLAAVMNQGHWSGELLVVSLDGTVTSTIQTFSLIYDNNGNPLYLANVVADITERKQAEADLEARLYELNALQSLMSREGWHNFQATRSQSIQGYLFDQHVTQPVTIADIQRANLQQGHLATPGHLTTAGHLPTQPTSENGYALTRSMAVYGEIIGQLGVYDDPTQPLVAEDQEFLDSIAAEVAAALERARLLEQIQRRAVELEAVAQVSTAVSTILDTFTLLQTIVDLTQQSFNLYQTAIFTYHPGKEALVFAAGSGELGRISKNNPPEFTVFERQSLMAVAVRTRQIVLSNDVLNDERFMAHPMLPLARSELVLPMLVGDRLLGVMDLQSEHLNHFTPEDVQTHATLVTQVAVAIENAQLFEVQRKVAADSERLYAASRHINEATNLTEIITAVAQLEQVPIINRIVLFLFERDETNQVIAMHVAANWHNGEGYPPSPLGRRYTQAEFSTVSLMISPEPLFFEDVTTDPRMDAPIIAVAQQQQIKAMAVLPLRVGGRQLGNLMLQAQETHKFTEQDIQAYLSVMPQVAVAVNNLTLLAEVQAALAEVETTQRRYTLQTWDAYRARTEVTHYEQTREDVQLPNIALPAAVVHNQSTISLAAADNGEPVSLITPLRVRGEVVGVLGLQETEANRTWTPEEVALVEAIAAQMAQAAENLRLLDETQQRAAREQRVNEISDKIQAAQSLEEALQIAVKEVGLSLQASETMVKLEVK